MRLLPLLAAALTALVLAAPASADSIVYVRGGNLFLTSPDGSKGYQLTSGGGYSSPSQADDGTIGAVHAGRLVRLDRSGRALGAPVDAIGSPGSIPGIAGPYDARLSPDGRRFAYWFYVQTATQLPYDPDHRIALDTGADTTWTWADRFTDPVAESGLQKAMRQPDWLTNDRLVGTEDFWMNMWTWKLGGGPDAAQFWFGLQDPPDQWGVAAYHWYDDPSVSPDGSRLAMTDGGHRLMLAALHGPAWVGEPPYAIDYVYGRTPVPAPTLQCAGAADGATNPTWSRDSSTVAYGAGDGVHVMTVPSLDDCGQASDRLLAPGAGEPAFGRADVDMSQAPAGGAAPSGPAAGQGGPAAGRARVTRLAVHPRAVRRGHSARVTFRLSAHARVTLTVRTAAGRRVRGALGVEGRRGANARAFAPRLGGRALGPGRYRLVATPSGGRAATAPFTVVR